MMDSNYKHKRLFRLRNSNGGVSRFGFGESFKIFFVLFLTIGLIHPTLCKPSRTRDDDPTTKQKFTLKKDEGDKKYENKDAYNRNIGNDEFRKSRQQSRDKTNHINPIVNVKPSADFPLQGTEGSINCGQTVSGDTQSAVNNYGARSPEHFYVFSLNATDRVQFDSCNSAFDTIIRIYDANTQDQLAVNDDSNSCGKQSNVTMSLLSGDYYVMIEGFGQNSGAYQLTMTCQIDKSIPNYIEGTIACDQTVTGNNQNGVNRYENPSPEHFYEYTLVTPQTVTFDACGSDFDTYIAIYNEDENKIAYNDDACGSKSILEVDLEEGTYYLLVEGFSNSVGNYDVTMQCRPYIKYQPSAIPTNDNNSNFGSVTSFDSLNNMVP